MGHATICIPKTDNFEEVRETGLSDQLAMSYGTLFARTLSEQDFAIAVTLESGEIQVIRHEPIRDRMIIRHFPRTNERR